MNESPAPRPIRFPKFTLIIGGVGSRELAKAISDLQPDCQRHLIQEAGRGLAGIWLGSMDEPENDEVLVEGYFVKDLVHDLHDFMVARLGPDYCARGFINNYDSGTLPLPESDEYVIADASIHDIRPFVDRFGGDNVLVLNTGTLIAPIDPAPNAPTVRWMWLPSPDLSERMKLLRRELGEL